MINNLSKLIVLAVLLLGVISFNACTEQVISPSGCSVSITSFSISPSSADVGGSITGSITINENIGFDDFTLRSLANLYLSTDNNFDGNDINLGAFADAPVSNGNSSTVNYNQIEIPFDVAAGNYFIIANISAQPCPNGGSSSATTRSAAITLN